MRQFKSLLETLNSNSVCRYVVLSLICLSSSRTWWWDSWVEPNNLYPIFLPFSRFVASLPLAQFSWTEAPVASSVSSVRAWGMVGEGEEEEVLVWVQDNCFTWPAQHEGKQCEAQTSVTLTVQGCSEGTSE